MVPAASGQEAAVSRQPPAIYEEVIAPRLTPLAPILEEAAPESEADDGESGSVLLQEDYAYVLPDGRVVTANHWILKAREEPGIETLASREFGYRRSTQKIHVAVARTIQPDGRIVLVDDKAIIPQSHQEGSADDIYSDRAQLTVIFPEVKVGSVTQVIIVREDTEAIAKGAFMAQFTWSHGWPMRHMRRWVDLPPRLAGKLRATTRGQVPDPKVLVSGSGRVRYGWHLDYMDGVTQEDSSPGSLLTGPSVALSTWQNWGALGQWFQSLLEGRDELPEELKAEVKTWIRDAQSPQEILHILTDKAANDVRYTGLEFGIAGFQPYTCADVWRNRFGDCKDKANLLRAFLKEAGMTSHLTLLDTAHSGDFLSESPSYQYFNHAILAVELPGQEGYYFVDPTIRHGAPGVLAPGDAGRPVLVIREDGQVDHVRTPEQSSGTERIHFDVKLERTGTLSGWLHFSSEGYYAASWLAHLTGRDHEARRQSAENLVRRYFPEAEVADSKVTIGDAAETPLRCAFSVYFVDAGSEERTQRLKWPSFDRLMPSLNEETRKTPMFIWPDRYDILLKIALPDGWNASKRPSSFQVDAGVWEAQGSWSATEAGLLEGRLDLHQKKALVSPAAYPAFRQALKAADSWLARSCELTSDPNYEPKPENEETFLEDFPMMPTGQGQLALVEARYPQDGNAVLRRRALNQVLQYFPDDSPARFDAVALLALMDVYADQPQIGLDRLKPLLDTQEREVSAEDFAWGRYLRALCLRELGQEEAARAAFQAVGETEGISDFRRGWSHYQAANLCSEEPGQCLEIIDAGLAFADPEMRESFFLLATDVLLAGDQAEELGKRLESLIEDEEEEAPAIFESLASKTSDPAYAHRDTLYTVLDNLNVREKSAVAEILEESLEAYRRDREKLAVFSELQEEIRAYFKEQPPKGWEETTLPENLEAREEWITARDEAETNQERELAFKVALEIVLRFDVHPDFDTDLWNACVYADWLALGRGYPEGDPWLDQLLEWGNRLPNTTDGWHEIVFVAAETARKRGLLEKCEEILRELTEFGGLAESYTGSAFLRHGKAAEALGRYDQALASYRVLEADDESRQATSAGIRAAILNLFLNREEEAKRLLQHLAEDDDDVIEAAEFGAIGVELARMTREGTLEGWIERSQVWLPSWQELCVRNGLGESQKTLPFIDDYTEYEAQLESVAAQKDATAYLRLLDRLAAAARCSPTYATEFARSLLFKAPPVLSEDTEALYKLITRVTKDFPRDNLELKSVALLCESLALWLDKDYDLSLARAKEGLVLNQELEKEDANVYTQARIYALAAGSSETEREEAAALLASQLESGRVVSERFRTVNILADLYAQLDRSAEAITLLNREIERQELQENPLGKAVLENRLLAVEQGATDLDTALADWLEKFKPAWYDFAEPKSLEDPRLTNIEELLYNPEQHFTEAEAAKLSLMVAQSSDFDEIVRTNALALAIGRLGPMQNDVNAWMAMLDAVFRDERFPSNAIAHAIGGLIPLKDQLGQDSQMYREHSSAPSLTEFYKNRIIPSEWLKRVQDSDLGRRVAALKEALAKVEVQIWLQRSLSYTLGDLMAAGRYDDAEELIDALKEARLPTGKKPLALRFALRKEWKAQQERRDMNGKLRAKVFEVFPPDTITKPEDYKARFSLHEVPPDSWHENEAMAQLLYNVKIGRVFNEWFWPSFGDVHVVLHRFNEKRALGFDLLKTAIEEAPDDLTRSQMILSILSMVDEDDPEVADRVKELLRPHENLTDAPITREAIRWHQLRLAVRKGGKLTPALSFTPQHVPALPPRMLALQLRHALQQQDKKALETLLDDAEMESLLDPHLLFLTIQAYDVLELKEEAELARERAQEILYRMILASWTHPAAIREAINALEIAHVLPEPPDFPQGWLTHLQKIGNTQARLDTGLRIARLNKDWAQMAKLSRDAVKRFPTWYYYHWFDGLAHYHLGDYQTAEDALEIYTHYAKDELQYPRALRLLEELKEKGSQKKDGENTSSLP